ncbi:NfeD family protein [Symbioplanes lichenis]|uniref:NfeD family protein n=1 Tax=Symbioplanes lichenis TaxID=1629072 RepID=UPI00273A52DD|nr:NfeD family protein [Actinoplanes lichenis]
MATATVVFLVIGGAGVAVLAIALLGGFEFPAFDALVPLEVIAGFVGAFGFVAAIAAELGVPVGLAGVIGLVAAVPAAWLAWRLSKAARNMPTDATPARHHLVGTQGVVVTPVPAGSGYGEVRLRLGGQPMKVYARADRPIPAGAQVFVVEAPSETSVVVEETPGVAETPRSERP